MILHGNVGACGEKAVLARRTSAVTGDGELTFHLQKRDAVLRVHGIVTLRCHAGPDKKRVQGDNLTFPESAPLSIGCVSIRIQLSN